MVDTVKVMLRPSKGLSTGKTHQALNMSSRQFNKLLRALLSAEPGTVFSGSLNDVQVVVFRRSHLVSEEANASVVPQSRNISGLKSRVKRKGGIKPPFYLPF